MTKAATTKNCYKEAYTLFSMTGTSVLRVPRMMSGLVDVRAMARDGLAPSLLEVTGDPALMEAAFHSNRVELEMFGERFFTRVAGENKVEGIIHLDSQPFFESVARHLTALGRP